MLFRLPILIILFLFLSFSSYAANSTPTLKNNNLGSNLTQDQPFDPDAANQTLDRINETKLLEEANTGALQQLISTINNLKLRAKQCIDDSNEGLGKLSKISPPTTQTEPQADISLADQQYIEQKQQGLKDEAAKCRLFIIRADEITADLSINLQKLLKNELLYSEAAVPQNFAALYNSIQTLPQAFNKQNFVTNSGIALFDSAKIIMLSLMLVFSITIGFWLKHLLLQYMGEKTETRYSYQIKQAFFSVSRKYIVLFAPITTFAICMSMLNYGIKEHTYLTLSSYGLLLYIVFLASIRFFFYPPKPAVTALSEIPHHLAKSLFRRASVFATICLIIFIGYLFLHAQMVPEPLYNLLRSIAIALISVSLLSIVWLVTRLPKLVYKFRALRILINISLIVGLLGLLVAEWQGYHQLSLYLLGNISITILAAYVAMLLHKLVKIALTGSDASGLQGKFKRYLGLNTERNLIELSCLKVILSFLIWSGFFLFLLRIWGLGKAVFEHIIAALIDGFRIADLDIIPSRIVIATLVFICLSILTRFLRAYFIKNAHQHLSLGSRESLGTVINYAGFSISVLIGLLVAGINFSNILIIAGALAVGIGFGLQKIANDFISGIILLIERPIKPGDRIVIGDTEGHVCRVGIRATHIITVQCTDIIVPNSEIMANNLTNYMLYDTNYYVIVNVNIAYGSDTELVQKTLMAIANENPQVITDRVGYEPFVLFTEFGDGALKFSLWCLIKDANFKGAIKSAINFEVEKRFREYGIKLAFPQSDVNIQNWPKN